MLREIDALSAAAGLRVANVFHAGDGNLHPLVLYDRRIAGQEHAAEELAGASCALCIDAGGSITGEHGVGRRRSSSWPRCSPSPTWRRCSGCAAPSTRAALEPRQGLPAPAALRRAPGPYVAHPLEQAGVAERF